MKFKRLFVIASMMMSVAAVSAQTESTDSVHVVDRGETLASIAQKYGLSEAQIIELNPDAAQFVYVGMELKLPENVIANAQAAKYDGQSAATPTTLNGEYTDRRSARKAEREQRRELRKQERAERRAQRDLERQKKKEARREREISRDSLRAQRRQERRAQKQEKDNIRLAEREKRHESRQSLSRTDLTVSTSTQTNIQNSNFAETRTSADDYNKVDFAMTAGYGFIPKPDSEASGTSSALSFAAGVNFNFTKCFYLGTRIGYYSTSVDTYDKSLRLSMSTDSHYVYMPVELGYRLLFTDNFGIVPYAGADLSYLVKAKQKVGSGSHATTNDFTKQADRFNSVGRVGLRLSFGGFNIGGAYVFPFEKSNYGGANGYPEISIGFGF